MKFGFKFTTNLITNRKTDNRKIDLNFLVIIFIIALLSCNYSKITAIEIPRAVLLMKSLFDYNYQISLKNNNSFNKIIKANEKKQTNYKQIYSFKAKEEEEASSENSNNKAGVTSETTESLVSKKESSESKTQIKGLSKLKNESSMLNSNFNSSESNTQNDKLIEGWVKVIFIQEDDIEVPSKFITNGQYYIQVKENPSINLIAKDAKGYVNIPSQEYFYAELTSDILSVYTARNTKYKSMKTSVILDEVIPQNPYIYKGGIEDIGNFQEGFCFILKYIHFSSKTMLEVCCDSLAQKTNWMKTLFKLVRKDPNAAKKGGKDNNNDKTGKESESDGDTSKTTYSDESPTEIKRAGTLPLAGVNYGVVRGPALIPRRFNDPAFAGYAPVPGVGPVLNPYGLETDPKIVPSSATVIHPPVPNILGVETLPTVTPSLSFAVPGVVAPGYAVGPGAAPVLPGAIPATAASSVPVNLGPATTIVGNDLVAGVTSMVNVKRTGWIPVGVWSPCSKPCGTGVQARSLKCIRPLDCEGNNFEERLCNIQECKHDLDTHLANLKKVSEGKWEYLGTWTLCSEPCGPGYQSITRKCVIPPCSGPVVVKHTCNLGPCNSSLIRSAKLFDLNSYPECQPKTMRVKIRDAMGMFYEATIIISVENIQIFKDKIAYMTLPLSHILTFHRSSLQPSCVDVTKDTKEDITFCPEGK